MSQVRCVELPAIDSNAFDVNLRRSPTGCDNKRVLGAREVNCYLVEERAFGEASVPRLSQGHAGGKYSRSDHILRRDGVDGVESEGAEDVPGAHLAAVFVL